MMNARNDVKKPFELNLDAKPLLAEARVRFAAWVDVRVARWLARCAADIEAAQGLFETDRKPAREWRMI
jgi:hypothetical protein